uniref:Putative 8.9 kDa family member n=1 Tax=Rhipicephalus pulchellus TaxID=72859 RepID=L7MC38_RHIPC
MIRKEQRFGLLVLIFITAQYILYIAHCQYAEVPCRVENGSCYTNDNESLKDGHDFLYPPPNCSRWVCNASMKVFLLYGCDAAVGHPYLALPMLNEDCYWPRCCNKTRYPMCFKDPDAPWLRVKSTLEN